MKYPVSMILAGMVFMQLPLSRVWSAEITLEPAPRKKGLDQLVEAPWVQLKEKYWLQFKPQIHITSPQTESAATGWLAVSNDAILLHLIVNDDTHFNTNIDSNIWKGDSIQFCIDARGDIDRPRVSSPGTAAYGFGLGRNGPVGYVYASGRLGHANAKTKTAPRIVRDEARKTTTYDIAIPWSQLSSAPGLSPTLGLLLQINDSDEYQKHQNRIYWGEKHKLSPEGFGRLRIGAPKGDVVSSVVQDNSIWRVNDSGSMLLAVAGKKPLKIVSRLGKKKEEITIPSTSEKGIQRYILRGVPDAELKTSCSFSMSVLDRDGNVLTHQETQLVNQSLSLTRMNNRIDELVEKSSAPLFKRHLRSVQAVANREWQLAKLMIDEKPYIARNAAEKVKVITRGLQGDAANWETYRGRRRKLVMTFMASDRTLQIYLLLLPKDWKPEKVYPMVVFLHGSGTSSVALDIASSPFRGGLVSPSPELHFKGEMDVVFMVPFARGKYGYKGIAADDVFRCVDDVNETIKIDPDRVYLTGFSMGGFGAWAIGLRSPDRWAAIVINAGGASADAPVGIGLGRNGLGVPIRISHGDADRAVPVKNAYDMIKELRLYGSKPEQVILKGVGHEYYNKPWAFDNMAWLLKHKRTCPNHFGFTADTQNALGRNGITLRRMPRLNKAPWFECRIQGQNIYLTSVGTDLIEVNPGRGGLGLSGNITVILNDKKVYEGPVKKLKLRVGIKEIPTQK